MDIQVGDIAPNFESVNQEGEKVSLSDYLGKKVVLYFYPKDDTPGCTKEACSFKDGFAQLKSHGLIVLGVSVDGQASHKKFAEKYQLPFDLIVDENKAIVEKYKVWGEKNMYGRKYFGVNRITFLIDEEGVITHVVKKVKTSDATNQILNLLGLI